MIVKTCKKHGDLTIEQVKVAYNKNKDGVITSNYYRCKECFRQMDRASWRKHAEKRRATSLKYKHENKEKVAKATKKYEQRQREELGDRYIRRKLIGETKLKANELKKFPELIELKRAVLLIKREVRAQNEHKKYIRLERSRGTNLDEAGVEKN